MISLTISDIRKIETILNIENDVDYPYPQRDGIVIPMDIEKALNSDTRNGFDVMVGTTKDEYAYWTLLFGKDYNLQIMQGLIGQALSKMDDGQNAYVYYFTEEANDPDLKSYHGYDLGFVLGNVDEASAKDIPAAYRLSEIMQQMWVNFAKTGDPSLNDGDVDGVGAIRWDKYEANDYPVMVFDAQNTRQVSDPVKEGSDLLMDLFWLKIKDK